MLGVQAKASLCEIVLLTSRIALSLGHYIAEYTVGARTSC